MTDDAETARMVAWLENQGLEHTERYVRNGRYFESWTTPALKERWVVAFKKWAADWRDKSDEGVRADLEAELRIRNEEPPYALVQSEKEKLLAEAKKAFESLTANPKRLEEVEDDLQAGLRAFEIDNKVGGGGKN